MRLPRLNQIAQSRQSVTVFGGLNHNPVIADGEWWDMENMTADHYPLLAPDPEGKKESLDFEIDGMISNNGLCYIKRESGDDTASTFVLLHKEEQDGEGFRKITLDMELYPRGKTLVSMGAYVVILPDKKWVNVAAVLDENSTEAEKSGSIEAEFYSETLSVAATDKNGSYIFFQAATIRPEDPKDGDMWLDISQAEPVLKKWYKASAMWMEEQSYVALGDDDQYGNFKEGDCLVGKAITKKIDDTGTYLAIPENPVVVKAGTDSKGHYIVVKGVFTWASESSPSYAYVTGVNAHWTRKMPDLDFVIESGNRLWGCKYGRTADGFVNEIYASKLGDFKNWNSFQGTSLDSYRASIGADGPFTGAINYNGRPIFFKEDCMIQVYGAYPAQYQINTIACDGVQESCSGSLAVVINRLYYWSRNGVCMYDGSLPVTISAPLGKIVASSAFGGGAGDKYYLQLSTKDDRTGVYVFDTKTGLWHKRDSEKKYTGKGCEHNGDLYMYNDNGGLTVFRVRGIAQAIVADQPDNTPVEWMVESGAIGLTTPDAKYISRLDVRMSLAEGSEVSFFVRYDFEDEWIHLTTIPGTNLRTFYVPIRPKRCDTMRLRIEGKGDAKIYSITKTMEQGGDAH